NISCRWIASATCFLKNSRKWGEQNAALCRGSSMAAPPPHFRHFTGEAPRAPGASRVLLPAPAGHDGPQLDHVLAPNHGVAGQELVAPDYQDGAGQNIQIDQQLLDAALAVDLDLAPRVSQDDFHVDGGPPSGLTTRSIIASGDGGHNEPARRRRVIQQNMRHAASAVVLQKGPDILAR